MPWIMKITGFIPQLFYYKRKTYYLDKTIKKRKYPAVLVSNHTAVLDFGLYMFVFFKRPIRPLAAEVLYNKNKMMTFTLNSIGAIRVDRDKYDFSFIEKSVKVLNKQKDVLIFPESRIPETKELLEFKPSFVEIALEAEVPVIPMFTTGGYGKKEKTIVVVGNEINLMALYDDKISRNENLINISNYVRNYIIELGEIANAYKK